MIARIHANLSVQSAGSAREPSTTLVTPIRELNATLITASEHRRTASERSPRLRALSAPPARAAACKAASSDSGQRPQARPRRNGLPASSFSNRSDDSDPRCGTRPTGQSLATTFGSNLDGCLRVGLWPARVPSRQVSDSEPVLGRPQGVAEEADRDKSEVTFKRNCQGGPGALSSTVKVRVQSQISGGVLPTRT